ncbi:PepSY domain-containing protein [Pseudoflavitalea sp. G-6-1-2]|uniref:PepSY-associated TM helix domain-containing protein n=1 Tax=Pseudoflavitalea sp. G-6-1-2 TaxID=2728841 RepID=UPI00146D5F9A|nr:PepSY-associated TM helix domain-containing protein [Pseudoflavitalea sp. G-6-1-2]NML21597.1 PepSY domain-containing protein [Pseudoflavitalea sp. G-6-1-2]
MKIFFRRIHLYLSLLAGVVILITCFTGAVLVFEEEMMHSFNKERYEVTPGTVRKPLSEVIAAVKVAEPKAKIQRIQVFEDPARTIVVSYQGGKKSQAFVNPYTAEVIELYAYKDTFFYTMFALHRWLLGEKIGKMIVGVSTLIFLFIIITGIVLWWPKNKAILKQRLKLKWSAGWKRINHDLHIVLGFYSAIFLFIFAFTGLAWSFDWFNNGIYHVTGSPLKGPKPPSSEYKAGLAPIGCDSAYAVAKGLVKDVKYISLSMPKDSAEAIAISSLGSNPVHESATDMVYLDQYSGKQIGTMAWGERSLGSRVRSTFKPVHVGSIWGMPSKIIALVVCILGVTFPVTGIIMWINRAFKKRKAK